MARTGSGRNRAAMRTLLALLAACLGFATMASAHEVRPAYLELRETAPGLYDVLWKVPALGEERRLSLRVRFPESAIHVTEPHGFFRHGAHLERWQVRHPGGLDGQSIVIEGLSGTRIDTLVRVSRLDGATQTHRATPDAPSVKIAAASTASSVAGTYLGLGVEHILLGMDHLLFVLALLLLVDDGRRLLGTITAFTLAHSLTLALSTLGFLRVPGPPVEACIALSIVFVAAEILRGRAGDAGITARAPWIVAFACGLLHGLGFASALREVGLPQDAIPIALLFFNVGVEAGQILFIAAILAPAALLRLAGPPLPPWLRLVPPYAIGSAAMLWVLQRVAAF